MLLYCNMYVGQFLELHSRISPNYNLDVPTFYCSRVESFRPLDLHLSNSHSRRRHLCPTWHTFLTYITFSIACIFSAFSALLSSHTLISIILNPSSIVLRLIDIGIILCALEVVHFQVFLLCGTGAWSPFKSSFCSLSFLLRIGA